MSEIEAFVRGLPKAELHVHIEGTLEPELMFDLAARNRIDLPYASVAEVRAAYEFDSLQAFLDIYYAGASVLVTQQDFADLMSAYLVRAIDDGVRRAEVFFDPQTHTERGVPLGVVLDGLTEAMVRHADRISTGLILCFLRHLGPEEAVHTMEAALPHAHRLLGVGLDSTEIGFPPERFAAAYRMAADAGLRLVAHAGEEGPAAYVWAALDALGAERIDHGVRAEDDQALVARLAKAKVPLTMCPLSNQRLQVFPDLRDHNLKRLLEAGVMVTVNSDDPAYFGGYIVDNYLAIAEALHLTNADLVRLAGNSLRATFLPEEEQGRLLAELADHAARGRT